jgi:hypothetical protein
MMYVQPAKAVLHSACCPMFRRRMPVKAAKRSAHGEKSSVDGEFCLANSAPSSERTIVAVAGA